MKASGPETARLLLRAVVGGAMIAHGIRHGRTLDGTAHWFGGIGFRQPDLQARMSAAVEIGAGGALLTGTATPIAAAAVIGTMAVAGRTVHMKNGYFIVDEGYEYVLSLAAGVGLATAAAQLAAFWRPSHRAEPDVPAGSHADGPPASNVVVESEAVTPDRPR
jgi:putative oxidoreductase